MNYWKDRVIIITGGSSGIGYECALKYLEENANVVLVGRNLEKLNKAKNKLKKQLSSKKLVDSTIGQLKSLEIRENKKNQKCGNKTEIYIIQKDIKNAAGCKEIIDETINKLGRIDLLINSAGIYWQGYSTDMDEQAWDSMLDTNLKGSFFMCKYSIPYLELTKGNIINISSDAGVVGNTEAAAYSASKGGLNLMTKSLALELAPKGIRVNAVCPCIVNTPMLDEDFKESGFSTREEYDKYSLKIFPQNSIARYIEPEEVANSVYFLSRTDRVEAITGECLRIDFAVTAGY